MTEPLALSTMMKTIKMTSFTNSLRKGYNLFNESKDQYLFGFGLGRSSSRMYSFGFEVKNFNAHDLIEIKSKINKTSNLKPNLFIANSIKGKGLKIAENNPLWHHKNNLNKEEIEYLKNSINFKK